MESVHLRRVWILSARKLIVDVILVAVDVIVVVFWVVIARVAVVVVRDVEVGGRLGANRYNLSSIAAQLCSQKPRGFLVQRG